MDYLVQIVHDTFSAHEEVISQLKLVILQRVPFVHDFSLLSYNFILNHCISSLSRCSATMLDNIFTIVIFIITFFIYLSELTTRFDLGLVLINQLYFIIILVNSIQIQTAFNTKRFDLTLFILILMKIHLLIFFISHSFINTKLL